MKPDPAQITLLPTAEDVAHYQAHGWYVTPMIIPDEIIDRARAGCGRYYAGERDWPFTFEDAKYDWKPSDGNVLRHSSYISLQNKPVRDLVMLPIIGAIAAKLTGAQMIRLFRDTLITKPPVEGSKESIAGWHTDRAYWLMCSSEKMLTAFVPLHDCTVNMGTLTMLDASHRWPNTSEMRTFHEQDLKGWLKTIDTGGSEIVEVPVNLKKGQASFHHCRMIHGSYPNLTDQQRMCITIHMQDEANHFVEYRDAEGNIMHHANDALCRKLESGFPDYTDPFICPVMWHDASHERARNL